MAHRGVERRQEAAQRAERALQLHLAGASYSVIAKALKYAGKGPAYAAVQRALRDHRPSVAEQEAAATEIARLDALLAGVWARARRGEPGAVDTVLRIEARRAEVLMAMQHATPEPPTGETPEEPDVVAEFQARLRERDGR